MGARHADGPPPKAGRRRATRPFLISRRSLHSIVSWPHPPLGTPFTLSPTTYWLQVTPLLNFWFPIGSSPCPLRGFSSAQATPSHLSPDPALIVGGSSPIHPSFIMHPVLGAWYTGVNQTPFLPSGSSGDCGRTRT